MKNSGLGLWLFIMGVTLVVGAVCPFAAPVILLGIFFMASAN